MLFITLLCHLCNYVIYYDIMLFIMLLCHLLRYYVIYYVIMSFIMLLCCSLFIIFFITTVDSNYYELCDVK